MLLLVYFNIASESTFYYISQFDFKELGENNKFGDILIGLLVYDHLEYKLIPYRTSWGCQINTQIRYEKLRKEKG